MIYVNVVPVEARSNLLPSGDFPDYADGYYEEWYNRQHVCLEWDCWFGCPMAGEC